MNLMPTLKNAKYYNHSLFFCKQKKACFVYFFWIEHEFQCFSHTKNIEIHVRSLKTFTVRFFPLAEKQSVMTHFSISLCRYQNDK